MKLSKEQKQKFIEGMLKNECCAGDFGLKDFYDNPELGRCDAKNCETCAIQACTKFFEENGL